MREITGYTQSKFIDANKMMLIHTERHTTSNKH